MRYIRLIWPSERAFVATRRTGLSGRGISLVRDLDLEAHSPMLYAVQEVLNEVWGAHRGRASLG
jgi:hypothetical protein